MQKLGRSGTLRFRVKRDVEAFPVFCYCSQPTATRERRHAFAARLLPTKFHGLRWKPGKLLSHQRHPHLRDRYDTAARLHSVEYCLFPEQMRMDDVTLWPLQPPTRIPPSGSQ